jgi:LCP family protein required for cell wall assembly
VKRQFVQMKPSRGAKPLVQQEASEWSPTDSQAPSPAARAGEVSPSVSPHHSGIQKKSGLLSQHADFLQHSQNASDAAWSYIEQQDTSIQQSAQGPNTDPILQPGGARSFFSTPISPHQSGITHMPFSQPQFNPAPPVGESIVEPELPSSDPLVNRVNPAAPRFSPGAQPFPGVKTPGPISPFARSAQPFAQTHTEIARPSTGHLSDIYGIGNQAMPEAPWPPHARPSQPLRSGSLTAETPWSSQMMTPGSHVLPQPASLPRKTGYQSDPPRRSSIIKQPRKKKYSPILVGVLAVMLLLVIGTGGGLWYYMANYAAIVANSTGQTATEFTTSQKTGTRPQQNTAPNGPVLSGKRINILLLGSDTDAKFKGTYLAQTDIVVTIDPATNYVGMLSIPRDMQVSVPGFRPMKLDEVFSYGFQSKKTSNPYADGAGLSIAAIEENYGITIDHYAWVGLDGFIKVIDTAGGVDIDVIHPMVDDLYPNDIDHGSGKTVGTTQAAQGYKRLYIAPGPQHLNGVEALEYVRTRHSDLVGDFGRSIRQQQVLNQLKARLTTSDLVSKLPELAKDMDGYVKTSMQLTDLIALANFARNFDTNKVERLVLSPPYSVGIKGTSNYAPNCYKITPALQKMFGTGTCLPQASNGLSNQGGLAVGQSANTQRAEATGNPSSPLSQVSQLAQVSTMSLSQGHGDMFGVHSLLNLLLMVSLESFDAMATT